MPPMPGAHAHSPPSLLLPAATASERHHVGEGTGEGRVRRYANAHILWPLRLSVCLSVCPSVVSSLSHVSVLLKWLNASSRTHYTQRTRHRLCPNSTRRARPYCRSSGSPTSPRALRRPVRSYPCSGIGHFRSFFIENVLDKCKCGGKLQR